MPLPNITLFGDRVAVTEISEEISGEMILPQSVTSTGNFELGKVYEVSENASAVVKKGDIVLFQIPNSVKTSTTYRYSKEDKMAIIHSGDVIGILRKPEVTLENFQIAGKWMLLSIEIKNHFVGLEGKAIVTPETAAPNLEDIHWKVRQLGTTCDVPCVVGDQIFIEKARANPIMLGTTELAFVASEYLYGTVDT